MFDAVGKGKKVRPRTVIYSALIFVLLLLSASVSSLYLFETENPVFRRINSLIPYPVAVIGYNNFVSYKELKDQLDSVAKFYENQNFEELGMRVDFSTPEGKKRLKIKEKEILNKLIENRIIEDGAQRFGIKLTDAMVSEEVKREVDAFGKKDELLEDLKKLYGWDMDDFERNIVKPDLYRERLSEHLEENDPGFRAAKEKIGAAKADLEAGKGFSETAVKYSEGDSAKDGGELGWYRLDQMLPQVAEKIPSMEMNRTSEIIRSPLGYHILMVMEKKTEDNSDVFRMRQIFVRGKSLAEWLDEQENNMSILIPLKDFYWERSTNTVEFQNETLRNFEKNMVSEVEM